MAQAYNRVAGIYTCAACGLPEMLYGQREALICQCNVRNAAVMPRDPDAPKFFPGMYGPEKAFASQTTPKFRR